MYNYYVQLRWPSSSAKVALPWILLRGNGLCLKVSRERRRLQPLFPYLRSARRPLVSPSGLMAGHLARVTNNGMWRSGAGQMMRSDGLPFPLLNEQTVTALREEHNLGVLTQRGGGLQLDDERSPTAGGSAEVERFMGWLQRELRRLGESLVFHVEVGDPRPQMALRHFFSQLFAAGALAGSSLEQAVTIEEMVFSSTAGVDSGRVGWNITLAPAYPIDHIRLTFVHTRDGWQTEVDNG